MKVKTSNLKIRNSSEAGYTILEGIMAIVVVSVMMIAIGPVIALSVGTRLQAKRTQMATQAARTYIEYVKGLDVDSDNPSYDDSITATNTRADLSATNNAPTSIDNLYCVDFDSDGECKPESTVDMVVQGIAYHPTLTNPTGGYILGVRVYRANSFAAGVGDLKTEPPATTVTNALGDRTKPLLTMTTQVYPEGVNFNELNTLLGN